MITTIRTTVGRENAVIETLMSKVKNSGVAIQAIFHPGDLKGYIFLEGDFETINELIKGVPHVKGLIRKEVVMNDIKKFLDVKKIELKIIKSLQD